MSIAEVAIVKQKILFPGILLSLILLCPLCAQAAGAGGETAVPIWLCIPFAGLLLCIAVMPLIRGEWWETHQPHAVIFWILAMVIPFAVFYGAGQAAETVLECAVNDYLTLSSCCSACSACPAISPWRGISRDPRGSMWGSSSWARSWRAASARPAPVCSWCALC